MTEVDHGPVMFIAGRRYPEYALYPVHVPYIQSHASNVNEGCLHQSRGRSHYVLHKTNIRYGLGEKQYHLLCSMCHFSYLMRLV